MLCRYLVNETLQIYTTTSTTTVIPFGRFRVISRYKNLRSNLYNIDSSITRNHEIITYNTQLVEYTAHKFLIFSWS